MMFFPQCIQKLSRSYDNLIIIIMLFFVLFCSTPRSCSLSGIRTSMLDIHVGFKHHSRRSLCVTFIFLEIKGPKWKPERPETKLERPVMDDWGRKFHLGFWTPVQQGTRVNTLSAIICTLHVQNITQGHRKQLEEAAHWITSDSGSTSPSSLCIYCDRQQAGFDLFLSALPPWESSEVLVIQFE